MTRLKTTLKASIAALPLFFAGQALTGQASAQIVDLDTDSAVDLDLDDVGADIDAASETDLDIDDDIRLTAEQQTRLYNDADVDGDGYLDDREYRAYVRSRSDASVYARIDSDDAYEDWYQRTDMDADGRLSYAEIRQRDRVIVNSPEMRGDIYIRAEIDADGDGRYDRDEYRAWVNARADRSPGYAFVRSENRYRAYFEDADTDRNGVLSDAELDAQARVMANITAD